MPDLTQMRQQYQKSHLLEHEVNANPLVQFEAWFNRALALQVSEPYAMTLATANLAGRPSVRTVLLRRFDTGDFQFYTHYQSEKGQDLTENPQAELLFFWADLEQQIRIRGTVAPLTEAESVDYFHKRPRETQLATHASMPQSGIIDSRDVLETRFQALHQTFDDTREIPKPEAWGGYRLIPTQFEFWQGRANRMHDRIQYIWRDSGWHIQRLMP